jgi:hypothetical protein
MRTDSKRKSALQLTQKYVSCCPHSFRDPHQVRCYFAAKQGLSGRQIGIGSPENIFPPTVQLTPGTQGGMGPDDRVAAPNAVPSATTKIPSMIFVFTVSLQCRSSGLRTDSKRKSALQVP